MFLKHIQLILFYMKQFYKCVKYDESLNKMSSRKDEIKSFFLFSI